MQKNYKADEELRIIKPGCAAWFVCYYKDERIVSKEQEVRKLKNKKAQLKTSEQITSIQAT